MVIKSSAIGHQSIIVAWVRSSLRIAELVLLSSATMNSLKWQEKYQWSFKWIELILKIKSGGGNEWFPRTYSHPLLFWAFNDASILSDSWAEQRQQYLKYSKHSCMNKPACRIWSTLTVVPRSTSFNFNFAQPNMEPKRPWTSPWLGKGFQFMHDCLNFPLLHSWQGLPIHNQGYLLLVLQVNTPKLNHDSPCPGPESIYFPSNAGHMNHQW